MGHRRRERGRSRQEEGEVKMENRHMVLALLFGAIAILILQVLAHHGPTPEETLNAIKCAERARALAEKEGGPIFVRCDDMGVAP